MLLSEIWCNCSVYINVFWLKINKHVKTIIINNHLCLWMMLCYYWCTLPPPVYRMVRSFPLLAATTVAVVFWKCLPLFLGWLSCYFHPFRPYIHHLTPRLIVMFCGQSLEGIRLLWRSQHHRESTRTVELLLFLVVVLQRRFDSKPPA